MSYFRQKVDHNSRAALKTHYHDTFTKVSFKCKDANTIKNCLQFSFVKKYCKIPLISASGILRYASNDP